MKEALIQAAGEVVVILLPVVIAAAGALSAYLVKLIKAKVDNQLLASGMVRVNDALFVVVKELMQTVVPALKAAAADGKLTDAEKAAIKFAAMQKLKSYVNLGELARLYGLADTRAAEQLLESKLEAAVKDVKDSSIPF